MIKKYLAQSPFGAIDDPISVGSGGYGSTGGGLRQFLTNALSAAITIAGIGLLFYLAYGGLTYLTSAGDEKNIEKAKKTISNALIGIVITAGVYLLIMIVETILKINILEFEFRGP